MDIALTSKLFLQHGAGHGNIVGTFYIPEIESDVIEITVAISIRSASRKFLEYEQTIFSIVEQPRLVDTPDRLNHLGLPSLD